MQRRQTSLWLESEGPLGSDISGAANTFLCSRRLATRRWKLSRNVLFQRHLEWKLLFHFAVMSGNTRLASVSLAVCSSSCTCFKLSPVFLKRWPSEGVFSHAVLRMAMLFGDVLFLSCPHSWSSVVAGLGPRLLQASEASDDAEAICRCSP